MSKERDFRKLIEHQDDANKTQVWQKISDNMKQNAVAERQATNVLAVKRIADNKKLLIIAAIILTVVLAVTGILLWYFLPKNEDRYGYGDNYNYYFAPFTIKQYAQENNLDILYLDMYDECEDTQTLYFLSNDLKNIVCLKDFFYDYGTYVDVYVTTKQNMFDFIAFEVEFCTSSVKINNVDVYYREDKLDNAVCTFEYKNYTYMIRTRSHTTSKEYVWKLAKRMLDTAK